MSLPLLLPTLQNWSCHNCGGCCRQHEIEITVDERQRIVDQNWTEHDGIPAGRPLFERMGRLSGRYRLGHQPDGACVFLDERGLCRIHAKFGEAAKPLACRIYPFAFHPAGPQIAVSLRFSCPSVVGNRGKPVSERRSELKAFERLVVPEGAERIPPPYLKGKERLDWADTRKVIRALERQLADDAAPITTRLFRALRMVDLVSQARFEKIRGARLDELLEIFAEAAGAETEAEMPPSEPGKTARMLFRMMAAQYARKDTFADRHSGIANRFRLFRAAIRFARGKGLAPPLQEGFAEVPFADLERSFGPLSCASQSLLARYLRVKIEGLHFCGPAFYGESLVEGFHALALIVPVVLYLARWLAATDKRSTLADGDIERALAIVDHHHGYSPAMAQSGFRARIRIVARTGEIPRLLAWYAR